jgi:hypothetical protein
MTFADTGGQPIVAVLMLIVHSRAGERLQYRRGRAVS